MDLLIYILIGLILILIGIIFFQNNFKSLKNRVKMYAEQMDSLYKERYDDALKLVEMAKKSAGNEYDAIENVWRARLISMGCNEFIARNRENMKLTASLKELISVCDGYEDIAKKSAYTKLIAKINEGEDKIEENKEFFNDAIKKYNNAVQNFPSNIMAKIVGYGEGDFVPVEDNRKKAEDDDDEDDCGEDSVA